MNYINNSLITKTTWFIIVVLIGVILSKYGCKNQNDDLHVCGTTLVIIAALVYCVWLLMIYDPCEYEGFTQPTDTTAPPRDFVSRDELFYKTYVGRTRIINFKCTYNGEDYYLANIPSSTCKNLGETECTQSVQVLIKQNDLKQQLSDYHRALHVQSEHCQLDVKLSCTSNCDKQIDACNYAKDSTFIHDFIVQDLGFTYGKDSSGATNSYRKYIVKGTTPIDKASIPTLFNHFLNQTKNIPIVCGDSGPSSSQNDAANIVVIETPTQNTGGIIGGLNSPIKIKLAFNSPIMIGTNPAPIIDQNKGIAQYGGKLYNTLYLGVCTSAILPKSGQATCNTTGPQSLTYPRLCLYSDITDKNVLDFEPVLVHNK